MAAGATGESAAPAHGGAAVHVSVDLGLAPPAVTLAEAEDCGRFDVVVIGPGDHGDLARALTGAAVGTVEGDEVLVDVAAVERLARRSVGPGWDEEFAGMLDFARSKGWLTEEGAIRAHIEWR
ncbi:MAG: hypothetical protein ACRDY1_03925 [Acidimicrobiales bacterium]